MKRAIAFTRVSTDKQDGARQLDQIRKYCKDREYSLLEEKTIGNKISGLSDYRDDLQELAELTRADADIIIVSEASRLTRKNEDDFMDLYNIVKSVQSTGLDLYILGSGQEYKADKKLTLIDVITLVIEADRNFKERETSRMRFATGKKVKVASGGYIGHAMPYGYRNNGQDKNYFEVVEEQAELIRIMFDLVYTHGYSVNKTANTMVRTHNTTWNTSSVLRHLRNPVYKGEFNIIGVNMQVPALVSSEVFDSVQYKITNNHLHISKGTRNINTLKGISKCACGCTTYIHRTGAYKGETYYNYICLSKSSAHTQLQACDNSGISMSLLTKIVWNITKSFINTDDFKVKSAQYKELIAKESKGIEKQLAALELDKIEVESRINNTIDTITRTSNARVQELLEKQLTELVGQQDKLSRRVDQLTNEHSKLQNKLVDLDKAVLPSLLSDVTPEEQGEIYQKYIDTVTYYSVNLNKGYVVIEYKNGTVYVVMTSTRPDTEAFIIHKYHKFSISETYSVKADSKPVSSTNKDIKIDFTVEVPFTPTLSFNPANRTVVETQVDGVKEYTYSDFFNSRDMEPFRMAL